jgi:hypothetical protein
MVNFKIFTASVRNILDSTSSDRATQQCEIL